MPINEITRNLFADWLKSAKQLSQACHCTTTAGLEWPGNETDYRLRIHDIRSY